MLTRRIFGARTLGLAVSFALPRYSAAAEQGELAQQLQQAFSRIEQGTGGRLGVASLDTETGLRASLRGEERFPMCGTFKALASAAVLRRVDRGESASISACGSRPRISWPTRRSPRSMSHPA